MIYEIYKDGESINTIVADESFIKTYCDENGYTYAEVVRESDPEPEPTEMDQLRADLDYLAALTGVEL